MCTINRQFESNILINIPLKTVKSNIQVEVLTKTWFDDTFYHSKNDCVIVTFDTRNVGNTILLNYALKQMLPPLGHRRRNI